MTKGWLKTFIRRKLVRLHDSMIKWMIYEILSYACCSGLITSFFFHVCPWSMKLFTLHCWCFTLCVDDCGKSRDLITTRSESDFFRDELYWRWLLEVWQKKNMFNVEYTATSLFCIFSDTTVIRRQQQISFVQIQLLLLLCSVRSTEDFFSCQRM